MLNLDVALWTCLLFAGGAVVLAFLGPEKSGALMGQLGCQAVTFALAIGIAVSGVRAVLRKRFDSALMHLGCACVMAGWLMGQHAARTTSEAHPVTGSMAMIDGDRMDTLWTGRTLTEYVGKLPFTVRLEKFTVNFYEGGMPREYRSRIMILEPGKEPRTEDVRVNHPAYVHGYHIYQMSWGESTDHYGRPVVYTVLQFIRDPGLPVVYAGFVVLLAGTLWFAARFFTRPKGGAA
ncbi:MAG: cytochrome c biogenesis protein ResB [Kiritimatiellaeota bacterium]|nr:cytochrome c biogenesis protein ResB [Kiritimatiellota bacterium]